MKYWGIALLIMAAVACGRADDTPKTAGADAQSVADQATAEAKDAVDRAKQGKPPREGGEGTEQCAIFDSGLIPQIFSVDPSAVSYRRSVPLKSAGHVLCMASWDKPNKAELDEDYKAAIMAWTKTMGQPDRKPMPKPSKGTNEASLTLLGDSYDSKAEAVTDLESKVTTLTEGVSVTVGGKVHETKMIFGDWIDGVGDKAIFSDKGGLMVATNGTIITVKVAAMDNTELDQEKAIELAQAVIPQL